MSVNFIFVSAVVLMSALGIAGRASKPELARALGQPIAVERLGEIGFTFRRLSLHLEGLERKEGIEIPFNEAADITSLGKKEKR